MSILRDGNVGIGTTSPVGQFQIQGNSGSNLVTLLTSPSGYWASLYPGPVADSNGAQLAADPASDLFLGRNGVLPLSVYATGAVNNALVLRSGNVGIGITNPQHPLAVNGTVQAKEVLVNTGSPDYVFGPGYRLAPLSEVANYIGANGHLPEIPSADEVAGKGVSLGEMQAKIEELTLHMIGSEETAELRRQDQQPADRIARLEGAGGSK